MHFLKLCFAHLTWPKKQKKQKKTAHRTLAEHSAHMQDARHNRQQRTHNTKHTTHNTAYQHHHTTSTTSTTMQHHQHNAPAAPAPQSTTMQHHAPAPPCSSSSSTTRNLDNNSFPLDVMACPHLGGNPRKITESIFGGSVSPRCGQANTSRGDKVIINIPHIGPHLYRGDPPKKHVSQY